MNRNGEQRKAVTEPEPRRSIDGQVAAAQAIIAKWLESCKEFPPRAKTGELHLQRLDGEDRHGRRTPESKLTAAR
jgi:hypothetical protein